MITVKNLKKSFGDNEVLKGIDYEIKQGEKIVIIGPSGSGKSTFLKLIMHEEKPTEGEIIFNEYSSATLKKKQVPYYRREMGIVFQDFRLIPKMSVFAFASDTCVVTLNLAGKGNS